jgi:hypothetical protein
MGGYLSRSTPVSVPTTPEQALHRELLEQGPLSWTAEQCSQYLQLMNLPELAQLALSQRIDGECLVEPSLDLLQRWFLNASNSNKHATTTSTTTTISSSSSSWFSSSSTLTTVPSEQLLSEWQHLSTNVRPALLKNKIVSLYLHPPPISHDSGAVDDTTSSALKRDERCASAMLAANTVTRRLQIFHDCCMHTEQHSSPSLKREWISQPKLTRRYYASPTHTLNIPSAKDRSEECRPSSLDHLLYFAASMSATQDATQRSIWPRTAGSKRTNPSSGGLHPEELYVWRLSDDNTALSLSHYLPKEHALELRLQLAMSALATHPSSAEAVMSLLSNPSSQQTRCLIAVSAVTSREIWK